MKKTLLFATAMFTLSQFNTYGAGIDIGTTAPPTELEMTVVTAAETVVEVPTPRPVASAADLEKIKAHISSYSSKLGLPAEAQTVGGAGCIACCGTSFDAAQEFLLNELAGQLLARFLVIALDDLADGRLDGIAAGKKVSYAKDIAALLGVDISESELHASPVDGALVVRLVGFATGIVEVIQKGDGQVDKLLGAAEVFAKKKMDAARKNLAVALIKETDRIISLELGNGKIDGLDAKGMVIDWRKEMKDSVNTAIRTVLYGVL